MAQLMFLYGGGHFFFSPFPSVSMSIAEPSRMSTLSTSGYLSTSRSRIAYAPGLMPHLVVWKVVDRRYVDAARISPHQVMRAIPEEAELGQTVGSTSGSLRTSPLTTV